MNDNNNSGNKPNHISSHDKNIIEEENLPQTNLEAPTSDSSEDNQADVTPDASETESKKEVSTLETKDPNQKDENPNELKEESKFKEGQILTFVNVRFPGHAKSFPFHLGKKSFRYGQKVVAMSDRGIAVGYINSFPYEKTFDKKMLPIQNIIKAVTEKELRNESENFDKEHEAKELCESLIKKLGLEMELTHVEYTQFGKKAVFYFTSPGRVDFRELVKELVSELKMRIELRQIYIRDRTAALGGIGPCGRELCCSSFLKKSGNVNIKMAKNQNLTLSPSKLNGVCGQLKCCLQYEDSVYTDKKQDLPEIEAFIQAGNGDRGKVEKIHILKGEFEMVTDQGKRKRYSADQYDEFSKLPPNWKFPERFDYIADETYNLISNAGKKRSTKKPIHNQEAQKEASKSVSSLEKKSSNDLPPNHSNKNEVKKHTPENSKNSKPPQRPTPRSNNRQQPNRTNSHPSSNRSNNFSQKNEQKNRTHPPRRKNNVRKNTQRQNIKKTN